MVNALFVCIGNSCRSQMAEGFARKYGSDVLGAWSAGLSPAPIVQTLTVEVMRKKNIDIQDQFPKSVHELELNAFDVIFNISGAPLRINVRADVRVWNVLDPMTQSEEVYVQVRDQIEGLVMQYILELRRGVRKGRLNTPAPRTAMPRQLAPQEAETPGKVSPVLSDPSKASQSSQRFGFGRVRKARD